MSIEDEKELEDAPRQKMTQVMLEIVQPMQKQMAEPGVWTLFMSSALHGYDGDVAKAAQCADESMAEYRKRFGG